MLKADASAHARKVQFREPKCAPPKCVADVLTGKPVRAPRRPLCVLGLPRPRLKAGLGDKGHAGWRGAVFEWGSAPFDSKFCAVWRAFFESFAPIERGLAPVYRL